jgi:hypothetical protein
LLSQISVPKTPDTGKREERIEREKEREREREREGVREREKKEEEKRKRKRKRKREKEKERKRERERRRMNHKEKGEKKGRTSRERFLSLPLSLSQCLSFSLLLTPSLLSANRSAESLVLLCRWVKSGAVLSLLKSKHSDEFSKCLAKSSSSGSALTSSGGIADPLTKNLNLIAELLNKK